MDKQLYIINQSFLGNYKDYHTPKTTLFYQSHIHNCYELLFFYSGDVDCIINGSIYHMQKNDLFLIPPSVYHQIRLLSNVPYERIWINFKEECLHGDLVSVLRNTNFYYHIEEGHPIQRIFDNIKDNSELFTKEELFYLFQSSINNLLLNIKYLSKSDIKEKSQHISTLDRILLYIDQNPTLPLNISALSKTFNLSESWISHTFKNKIGVSPSQYINRKKILYAQSLINTGLSPVQAADACCYINYTTFYRQYKKYLGIPPKQDKH